MLTSKLFAIFALATGLLVAKEPVMYRFSVPVISKTENVSWVYEANKRRKYSKNYDPLLYDEAKIPYTLALFSLFQHEAPYLKEWIEYHLLLGVEHFYLYNNLSNDNYFEVLEPYITRGIVTLVHWPYIDPEDAGPFYWCEMQKRAYENAMQRARGKYRWMAFIDTDEFFVPMKHNSLPSFLSNYENYGGVVINWLIYGTSNVECITPDKLLISELMWRGEAKSAENEKVKSIVKPHRVSTWPCPHYAEYKPGFFAVDPTHTIVGMSQYNPLQPYDVIRINHYWFRDVHFYWNVKIPRWKKTAWQLSENDFMLREEKMNRIYDPSIARFASKLSKRMKNQGDTVTTQRQYVVNLQPVTNEKEILWAYETRRCTSSAKAKKEHYPLALFALFHNNAPLLRDWIEYHKMMGVSHFYLYNCQSSDTYQEVLIPYLEKGEVTLIQWPQEPVYHNKYQIDDSAAYADCLKRANAKWLLRLWLSETLVCPENRPLTEFLSEHTDQPSVCLKREVVATEKIQALFQKLPCALVQPNGQEVAAPLLLEGVRIDCYPSIG